ncbi:MAG: VCBS repeat-containing protein [Planctomycetes bacterium]|nr:VCBS repeat-containing protein [Planctomycetota bacterium]
MRSVLRRSSPLLALAALGAAAHAQLGPAELYTFPAEGLVRLDFDADRFPDLAYLESGALRLARNAGDGTFFAAPALPVSLAGRLVAVRANGDAARDLLVIDNAAAVAQSFLRTGAPGGFSPGPLFALPPELANAGGQTYVADLDRDGREDVLHGTSSLFSNGDGTFRGQQASWIASGGVRALCDLDVDGFLDAVSVDANPRRPSLLWIAWGSAQGFLLGSQLSLSGLRVGAPVVGDLDGDGLLDLACAGTNAAYLLFGAGGRSLLPALSFTLVTTSGPAVLGDFDGDGRIDLAFGTPGSFTQVLQNQGGRSFGLSVAAGPGEPQGAALLAVDLDEDGRDELCGGEGTSFHVLWSLGGFAFRPETRTGYPVERLAVLDLDRDGDLDLLVSGGSGAGAHTQVLRNQLDPSSASYGSATPGSGGLAPRLAARGGIARAGNLGFGFRVDQALGRSAGLVWISRSSAALPLPDAATLYVAPPFDLELPLALAGRAGVAGDGSGQISTPLPLEMALVSTDLFAQAVVLDPARASGLCWTAGLRVRLVP